MPPPPGVFFGPDLEQRGAAPYTNGGLVIGYLHQGGDAFSAIYKWGSTDNQDAQALTNGLRRFTILKTGQVSVGPADPGGTSAFEVQDVSANQAFIVSLSGAVVLASERDQIGPSTFRFANANGAATSYAGMQLLSDTSSFDMRVTSSAAAIPSAWILNANGIAPRVIVDNNGRVSIGQATPDASARLDVQGTTTGGTTGGFLMPRLTTAQRNGIAAPATSLLVWNTNTAQFEFWNGAAWVAASLAASWLIGGQAIGGALVGGTTDNNPTVLIANSVPQLFLFSGVAANSGPTAGPVGVGAGQAGRFLMQELLASGTNVTGFKAPDALAADVVYTMPAADGSAGQALTTSGAGVLSWAYPLVTRAQWGVASSLNGAAGLTQYFSRWTDPLVALSTTPAPTNVPLEGAPGALAEIVYSFVGAVGNVAGQTVEFQLLVNGVAVVGATTGPLATNSAAATTGTFPFSKVAYAAGVQLTCAMILSAQLTTALTLVYVSAGG